MELVLATRNPHKTREIRALLGKGFELTDFNALPEAPMPEETGSSFAENAILKAISVSKDRSIFAQLAGDRHQLVLADDSGLEVDALGGAPGIYSARYASEHASDAANIDKLLRELKHVTQRSARFRCVIAVARAGKLLGTFEGIVKGEIVDGPRGTRGFGYDPVFQPAGFDRTFAEMPPELKNRISHRAKATAALREALRAFGN